MSKSYDIEPVYVVTQHFHHAGMDGATTAVVGAYADEDVAEAVALLHTVRWERIAEPAEVTTLAVMTRDDANLVSDDEPAEFLLDLSEHDGFAHRDVQDAIQTVFGTGWQERYGETV